MAGSDDKCQCGRKYPPHPDVTFGEMLTHVQCARHFISHFQQWVRNLDDNYVVPKDELEEWIDFLMSQSGWDHAGIDVKNLEAFAGAN